VTSLTEGGIVPLLLAISDNGPQMRSHSTREFLAGIAIAQQFGRPHTPEDQASESRIRGARYAPDPPMNPRPAPSNPVAAGQVPDSRPRTSGRTRRDTPIAILSPAPAEEPSTQISRGARRTSDNRGHRPTPTGAIMSHR
jgi:hypothetical protein